MTPADSGYDPDDPTAVPGGAVGAGSSKPVEDAVPGEGEGAAAASEKDAHGEYAHSNEAGRVAVELLDAAHHGRTEQYAVIDALRAAAEDRGLAERDPLLNELIGLCRFRFEFGDRGKPGCDLIPDWGASLSDPSGDVLALWRHLAEHCTEPGSRARASDLLWLVKDGQAGLHARAAIDAYVVIALSTDPVTLDSAGAAVRAWDLVRRVGASQLLPAAYRSLVGAARRQLDSGEYGPGIVLPLLSAAAATAAYKCDEEVCDEVAQLEQMLEEAFTCYRADHLLAETADLLAARAPDDAARLAVRRRQVQQLLDDARQEGGMLRQARLAAVIEAARRFGIRDLETEATRDLQRIRPDQLELHRVETSMRVPADQVARYVARYGRGRDWRDALKHFLWSSPPTGHLDDLKAQAADYARTSIARNIATRVQLTAAGLPTYTIPPEDLNADLAFVAQFGAAMHGELLASGLERLVERFGVPAVADLDDYLIGLGAGDTALAQALASGLRHFWAEDYDSAVHLVVPKIETALRALLREADVATYRIQVGNDPGGYVGLYPLLTELEKLSMDPDWVYFLRWLLTGPPNRNLRNDVAHGLLAGCGRGTTALALRAAALVILIAGPATPEGWSPDEDGPSATTGETTLELRTPAELVEMLGHPVQGHAGTTAQPRRSVRRAAASVLRRLSWGAHRAAMRIERTALRL